MMYKIIQDGKVIDVIRNPSFVKFLSSGHIAITDKSSAQGIVGSDSKTVYSFGYETDLADSIVKIDKISLNEFNRLQSLLNSEIKLNKAEKDLLAIREVKVTEISEACREAIISGFSVTLKDGKKYCFRLTMEDQINLLNLENQLNTGTDSFLYHSTDAPCRIFTRDDMKKVIKAYRKHVLYHTTYFNAVKQYINSLTDTDKIKGFSYGTDISLCIKESTVRQILREGGNV